MKITLLTVGKTDKDWVKQGIDIYSSRLKHYIPFSINEIPELKNVSSLSKEQIKTRERLDHSQGDSEISKPFVRKGKDHCRDGGGERVSRGERKIVGIFNK